MTEAICECGHTSMDHAKFFCDVCDADEDGPGCNRFMLRTHVESVPAAKPGEDPGMFAVAGTIDGAPALLGVRALLADIAAKPGEVLSSCPCVHTTPCDPDCTCVNPWMSRGCARCCSYGSLERRKLMAEHLARKDSELAEARAENERLAERLKAATEIVVDVEWSAGDCADRCPRCSHCSRASLRHKTGCSIGGFLADSANEALDKSRGGSK